MDGDCTCPWVAEELWTRVFGIAEPGSQREFDPECPVHGGCESVERGFRCGLPYGHGGNAHVFHDEDRDYYVSWPMCGVSAGGTWTGLSKQDVDDAWADSGPDS